MDRDGIWLGVLAAMGGASILVVGMLAIDFLMLDGQVLQDLILEFWRSDLTPRHD